METGFQNTLKTNDGLTECVPCGLVVKDNESVIGVPLVSVDVAVQIIAIGAEVTLKQTFINNSEENITTSYFFPVETNVALHFFEACLNCRTLTGTVKEKRAARQDYQMAISKNKTAFLLEEVKSDIMELYVGNFKAGSVCEITVKYIQEVDHQDSNPRFTLPTTIAPRYIPLGDENSDKMASINFQYLLMEDIPLGVKVELFMNSSILSIKSPTHEVEHTIYSGSPNSAHYATAELKQCSTNVMDRDYVLIYETYKRDAICVVEKGENSTALMLSFVPEFTIAEEKCELIFLVDCSGSMCSGSIGKARDALNVFLRSLPEDCFFNIYRFGSTYNSLFTTSQRYTGETFEKAKGYIKYTDADLGGTEILKPLKVILNAATISGYHKRIFILTDGQVSNTKSVIKLVKDSKKCRVFTIGIGQGASRELVKGMALAGNGVSTFCTLKEPMHTKVISLLNCAGSKAAFVEKIRFLSPRGKEIEKSKTVPYLPMPIYSQEKVIFYAVIPTSADVAAVEVRGASKENKIKLTYDQDFILKCEKTVVHKLATAKLIRTLMDSDPAANKSDLTALAIKHSLVTPLTSIVCVDETVNEGYDSKLTDDTDTEYSGSGTSYSSSEYSSDIDDDYKCLDASDCSSFEDRACIPLSESLEMESLDIQYQMFCSAVQPPPPAMRSAALRNNFTPKKKEKAKKSRGKSDGELVELLSLSNNKGVFSDVKEFCRITGIREEELEKLNSTNIDRDLFLTALCLAYLKMFFSHAKTSWALIETKASKWIAKSSEADKVNAIDFDAFIKCSKAK